jgi:TetR/AcrR family transcriptional regulator, transcriptional repressor for nem operon
MPRPREFDEASALKAAMECFWRCGYEATSLRDLTGAMGLTAPSIYNAFGDKQQLFGRAREQYLEHTTRQRLRRLQEELPPKEAIRRFLAEIVDHSINDRQRKGCFLVNSALEVAPHDAKCRAVIAAQFENIEAFFRECILAGQTDRTISPDIEASEVARLLLGVLLGIRVLARAKPRREILEGVAGPALAMLDKPDHHNKRVRR